METLGPWDNDLKDLIKIGEELSAAARGTEEALGDADITKASAWVARVGQIIRNLYPQQSQHLINYEACIKEAAIFSMHSRNTKGLAIVTGIVKAVLHELEQGLLVDIRQLLRADIFSDFLEMAEHLLDQGYKDAAAVVIGSVLEDSLRKLAEARGIETVAPSGKPLTLDPLNVALAKDNTYNKLVQKQVVTWAQLRNDAAHGKYDQYDEKQVKQMLIFTQSFCAQHLH